MKPSTQRIAYRHLTKAKVSSRRPQEIDSPRDMEKLTGPLVLESEGDENLYFTDGEGQRWFFKHDGRERDEKKIRRYLTAAGSGAANAKYLGSIPPAKKAKILKHIAKHYGVSVREIEKELVDRDAENLFEYAATDRSMAMEIYNDFKQMRLMASKTAGGKARAEIHTRTSALFLFLSCKVDKAKAPINQYVTSITVGKDYKALGVLGGKVYKALAGIKQLDFGAVYDVGPMGPTVQTSPNEVFTWLDLGDIAKLKDDGHGMEMISIADAVPDMIKALEGIGIPVQVK